MVNLWAITVTFLVISLGFVVAMLISLVCDAHFKIFNCFLWLAIFSLGITVLSTMIALIGEIWRIVA